MTNCPYFHCQYPNCPNNEIRSCGYSESYLLEKVIKERNEMSSALKPFVAAASNRLNAVLTIIDNLKEETYEN